MPIHEYRCTSCGARFESLVLHGDPAAPHCPQCGAVTAERLLSVFAVGRAGRTASDSGACGSEDCACRRDVG